MVIGSLFASATPVPHAIPISDGSGGLDAWINNGSGAEATAEDVSYSNGSSGLSATNVQDAIDELALSIGSGAADIQTALDALSSTHGAIIFRGALAWQALAPGLPGQFLMTNGSGADPSWEPAPAPSPFFLSMVDWWEMNELSGNRAGSFAGLTLTDNNGVGNAPGVAGTTAASLVAASSQKLTRTSEAALQTGNIDFSLVIWAYLNSKATYFGVIGKYGTNREFLLYYDLASDRYRFLVSSDGSNATTVAATTYGSPATGAWVMFYVEHNAAADTIGISVNNGTLDIDAFSAGVFVGTEPFLIGQTATAGQFLDGRVQRAGFWKRLLSATERTQLYNAGSGLSFPFR